jgi:putative membrane protein
MKPVGKPDAGNPHVRFDERGWETGRRPASAPAPNLDSTAGAIHAGFTEGLVVYLIVNWVCSVAGLLLVASLIPGFQVAEFESALIAAAVVGLISAGLGTLLKHAGGPVGLAITGIFLVLTDTLLFRMSALLVPGFAMRGLAPAFAGAMVLLALNLALLRVVPLKENPLDSPLKSEGNG